MKFKEYERCELCPRRCRVNRNAGEIGFCGEGAEMRIASIGAHFGEEPPISGTNGSGTVFFSGCSLQCSFCQNYQISLQHLGDVMSVDRVVAELTNLYYQRSIHNVNFVTPDHFFPHTMQIVRQLREHDINIPALYNMSGYERVAMLRQLEPIADIYLPDFKYADKALAEQLSHCRDYPAVALDALAEMLRQKGMLDIFRTDPPGEIATQGVLVRHLILPGQTQNSLDALTALFVEFGKRLPISLMSQYHPTQPCPVSSFDRRIALAEFEQVYDHAMSLGFEHLFVQFPEERRKEELEFLPDFSKEQPFAGNT
ncbi:uncharacterized Fe-S protein PflX, homolog of pyruvate formate lyase activating [Candidatus Moduliflexus flocculans]|uniref:Uncharacterized Fe-S protein PflX, homolog of pyruvate formate lyase activating n=1 Tax=Candidatus Moduliflexus flocculans TaxID=1499966 RepID=A0A081BPK6_9BACT|nr:uncharacterized Fe-S protein PflX, homolog of pyruvate formate lyase activating [Candidatus Moduliflexus flocculans]